ncbi:MAG: zinc ribbon domain-containing protein, partial [Clostridia bacterium]|nr:zinc ribbon domain-containing protein [Clostridia bacterium]
MKFCHMCGSQNEDSFIYCYACGEKLFRAKGLKEKAESTEYTEHQVEEPITEEETEMIAPVEDFFDRNSEKVYEPAEEPDAEPEAGANSRYSSYEPYSSDAYSAYSAPTPEPVVQEIYGYQYEPTEPEAPRSRSRSTNPFLIGGIVAALAVVIVLVGYFTDWFGSIEPIDKFLMTASNTMNATSGTVNLKASIDQH